MVDPAQQIVHAGRVIKLSGPGSQNLKLQGTGEVLFAWEPADRSANDLELRARIVSASGGIGSIPVVRWKTEIGHGSAAWVEPQPSFQDVAGSPMLNYSLPARGMAWHVTTRWFRIAFANQGTLVGGVLEESTVQVTVLPTWSAAGWALYPYSHLAFPVAGVQQPFPMTAREWRLRDSQGQPIAVGAISILFVGLLGALFGVTDAALFKDYGPIPHEAVAFDSDAPVYADYR